MGRGAPRIYDLAEARPEGWFDQVLHQSPDFEKACRIIGRNTLGLGLIAGARILSLTPSAESQGLTSVEFSMGADPTVRHVPLDDFRTLIAQHLLLPLQGSPLPDEPNVDALQAHIGGRYMLEAALFEVQVLELRHELGISEVALEFNGVRHVLALEDFRDVIDERVRAELGLGQPQDEIAIDLALVDLAEAANAKEDWSTTVGMLTPWLAPISMLLRTGEADDLAEEVHGRLSDGLDLLGTAYAKMGELDTANEVLRLGVQWAGESSKAADLFFTLGQASAAAGKHGEAIGLLRRAIRLGIEERAALPLLAESLQARDQSLAAMVCLKRARSRAANPKESEGLERALLGRLGETWARFEAWMSDTE